MGLRLGSRKRKEKQTEQQEQEQQAPQKKENEKKEKPKRTSKVHRRSSESDKSNARPPKAPGSLKSSEAKTSTISNVSGSNPSLATATSTTPQPTSNNNNNNRGVLFRDNRLPDGTAMPRIPTTQNYLVPPGADKDGRMSPTGSIYSSASLQAPFPSFASYPVSYVPHSLSKHFDSAPRSRGRIHSDGTYRSLYGDPLPKPDYPLSNDGTGNSNRDSGLDSESRSSSGGKPPFAHIYESSPQQRTPPQQFNNLRSRPMSNDRSSGFYNLSEKPQILRPKGYQGSRDNLSYYPPSSYPSPQRFRGQRPPSRTYEESYRTSATPKRWICQKEDYEEETYRPQSERRPLHCSSCSCGGDLDQTPRCTSSLRRIQLEDETPRNRRYEAVSANGKRGRRYRRDDEEEEYSMRSTSRGLPRNQPVRGQYFEEREEVDRYGRLPPVRRPISARPSRRDYYEEDEDNEDGFEYSEEEEEGSDFQEPARNYAPRKQRSSYYDLSRDISQAGRDTSVIKL